MQDLSTFTGTLPYASELFGIYQPLLGWKSQLIANRYAKVRTRAQKLVASTVLNSVRSGVSIRVEGERNLPAARWMATPFQVENLKPAPIGDALRPAVSPAIDSGVARLLRAELGGDPPAVWGAVVTPIRMTDLLERFQSILNDQDDLARRPDLAAYVDSFVAAFGDEGERQLMLRALFDKEARIAGYLIFLAEHSPHLLTGLFYSGPKAEALKLLMLADPLLSFGDRQYQAILSPVGIMHLYREYFFEFDSFLGPPVGHVWLSPGGTVELIEVNTRKVFTERSIEQMTEETQRSETSSTMQDDVADAVKEENRSDVKFGFTNTAKYTTPVFQDTATASMSVDNAKTTSRETTHKRMRQQSEKLSSEIKRNFKTTFKTSTEVTDTTSKRYVIANTSKRLVNYELRRKMRKVGVQVQDIGLQLCWHTFVDDPGAALGISKLVHIGEPPDMAGLTQPDAPVDPTIQVSDMTVPIPFVGLDTSDNDIAYTNGSETEVGDVDAMEHIKWQFPFKATPFKSPGFTLSAVAAEVVGFDAHVSVPADKIKSDPGSSQGEFQIDVNYVNWNGNDQFQVKVTLTWSPDQASMDKVKSEYAAKLQTYTEERARRYKEAFLKASRDRIKAARQVKPRPAEDLREEERTVVYRRLISQLMKVGAQESKHVVSELIRSIFDVDKMLYFVAPEWWVPRLHRSTQHLGEPIKPPPAAGAPAAPAPKAPRPDMAKSVVKMSSLIGKSFTELYAEALASPPTPSPIPAANVVDWGGAAEYGRDNYYVTEDSAPAPLGSSLGWLLQLDGDNLRNAMLNAPWVKAVIPIRIGKELEAINWLRQAHVEGEEGLDAAYVPSPQDSPELQAAGLTVLDALKLLIGKVHEFDQAARTAVVPNPADPEDSSNHFAGSLPTEAVFENGFYPLKGGVRFNQSGTDQTVFSQWMEILPTDQVAALEVEYDPKTLQVKVVPPPAPAPEGGGGGDPDHDHDPDA
jgi:hypothetical protein